MKKFFTLSMSAVIPLTALNSSVLAAKSGTSLVETEKSIQVNGENIRYIQQEHGDITEIKVIEKENVTIVSYDNMKKELKINGKVTPLT